MRNPKGTKVYNSHLKSCRVPRNAFREGFQGNRLIEVGMSDPDYIFDSIYTKVDTSYMISSGDLIGNDGTRFYHITSVQCCPIEGKERNKFLQTPCYCVKIEDGIVTQITKHLPYKGDCRNETKASRM